MWLRALDYLVAAAPAPGGPVTPGGPPAEERAWRAHMAEALAAIEADELLPPVELLHRLCGGGGDGGGGGGGGGGVPLGVAVEIFERHLRTSDAAAAEVPSLRFDPTQAHGTLPRPVGPHPGPWGPTSRLGPLLTQAPPLADVQTLRCCARDGAHLVSPHSILS